MNPTCIISRLSVSHASKHHELKWNCFKKKLIAPQVLNLANI